MLRNVKLSNLENVLQRNLIADSARECIFRAFGGTNFENVPTQHEPWWCLREFDVYTGVPKIILDTPLTNLRTRAPATSPLSFGVVILGCFKPK